jgi:hypothetical protein
VGMNYVYLVIENIELAKNDIERTVVEAHLSKESALYACKVYNQHGKECWVDEIRCVTSTLLQQKLNLL